MKGKVQGETGMKKCGNKRCKICDFVEKGNTFKRDNKTYKINFTFDFNSKGVVYLITSKQCQKKYVGSTIIPLRKRFNNNRSSIVRYGNGA